MSSRSKPPPSSAQPSARSSPTRRLLKELETWRAEAKDDQGIDRLGPVSDGELLTWEAVLNGRGIGGGYDDGRWLLRIAIPPSYPLHPPQIRFVTPVVHANVDLASGAVCLDLLTETAWTPVYGVVECVRAVRMLLACPETDSPLNVDVAALLRDGDAVGARGLVELWCGMEGGRYDGP